MMITEKQSLCTSFFGKGRQTCQIRHLLVDIPVDRIEAVGSPHWRVQQHWEGEQTRVQNWAWSQQPGVRAHHLCAAESVVHKLSPGGEAVVEGGRGLVGRTAEGRGAADVEWVEHTGWEGWWSSSRLETPTYGRGVVILHFTQKCVRACTSSA